MAVPLPSIKNNNAMRQILLSICAILFACCSSEGGAKAETNLQPGMAKTLIVYYSYTGNCEAIVSSLAEQVVADRLEIQPAEKGLRYEADNYALGTQLLEAIKANPTDAGSYPAIDPVGVNLDAYENIIVVTPLWWSQMAAIMQTFLFQHSAGLAGKTVALVVSSHSSGISGVVADAHRLLPGMNWAGDALHISNAGLPNRSSLIANWLKTLQFKTTDDMTRKFYITIGGVTKPATLAGNSSAAALVERLQQADITYEAHDYGNFEKVGALGFDFPENNEQITTEPGDLILYMGNALCIYYAQNSWNFTRIGKLDHMTQAEVKEFVCAGQGNVTVTLSLADKATGIGRVGTGKAGTKAYTLHGMVAQDGQKGLVIKNGAKTVQE